MTSKSRDSKDLTVLEIQCGECNHIYAISVYTKDIYRYNDGALVQNAFPYLTIDERELIISKTCGKCFDKLAKRWARY